ncbi:MAG TPA: selenocysteine-specific translation elongation factor [Candidatus Rubrimentiphilum sp.]|nr:selenocysteine-specific translation elongation factor [Candidatus Rubrimentiphilum sp.]
MHIVGTAGHVDHGKSALVNALTGTNPDRWLEEQLRGMTLDLGFAHLKLDDGIEAGIVDVPGHERFLHNMLAGAAGMELLLLVIAADEGPKPQTFEHLQILRYLNVRDTIVALTKSDLVPSEDLPAIAEQIHQTLKGTIAQDAPLMPVSSVTGLGLDALRATMQAKLAAFPARMPQAPAYLPIDRVFVLPGHGTIVTGTLMQGSIAVGEKLQLEPLGKVVHIRSLQTFGRNVKRAEGGARVAANLRGIDVAEISRGEMLVAPQFASNQTFTVSFEPLNSALPILRRRNAVRTYIGSAEILGTLVLDSAPQSDAPVRGTLSLKRATVAYPGSAFVVRRLSPKDLIGGGHIEGVAADQIGDEVSGTEQSAHDILRRAAVALTPTEIARESNLRVEYVEAALETLRARGAVFLIATPAAYLDTDAANAISERIRNYLTDVHQREPWALGATSIVLARSLNIPELELVRLLDAFVEDGRIARRAGYYSLAGHAPALTSEQTAFFEALVPLDAASPYVPADLAAAVTRIRQSPIPGVGKAFDALLAKEILVKVSGDLYRGSQIAQIRARLQSFLKERERITMAEFRDLIGTSRKYAVPLLEWFDARGITVRSGDYRFMRRATEATVLA